MNKYCQEVNAYGPMVPIAHTINVNTKINKIFQHSYILVTNQSGPYLHMHEQKLTPVGYSVSSEMLLSELVYWVTLDFPHLLQNFLPNHCIIQICQLLHYSPDLSLYVKSKVLEILTMMLTRMLQSCWWSSRKGIWKFVLKSERDAAIRFQGKYIEMK